MERQLFGVLGWPVGHSLSPRIHSAAFRALRLDATYLTLGVPPERLVQAVQGLRGLPFRGVNVTIPHKQAVLPLLDEVSDAAAKLHAVNTIAVGDDGRLIGHNTDFPALLRVLGRDRIEGRRVLVLGAGGAALACTSAAQELKATAVFVCARQPEQAAVIAARSGAQTWPWQDRERVQVDVVLHATPVGMATYAGTPLERLPVDTALVYDLVYNPPETELMRVARAAGIEAENGLGMLVEQAALSFEIWFGRTAPRDVMRQVAREWLQQRP